MKTFIIVSLSVVALATSALAQGLPTGPWRCTDNHGMIGYHNHGWPDKATAVKMAQDYCVLRGYHDCKVANCSS